VATHYDVLGVRADASGEEIQQAYRLLARLHHPDVAPDADRAVMAAINGAWMVLSDPVRRRDYDAALGPPPSRTAPPTSTWRPLDDDDDEIDPEEWSDEPYVPAERRPSDHLVMTPVLLLVAAVGVFFFSLMSGSTGLRTLALLLVPVAGVGFVLAPLFVMLRSRSRSSE
jgi:hypothetical protein